MFQFSSVTQSCPTLRDTMNRSTPGLPVHYQLPEFTQTHVHRVSDPSSHLILCRPLLLLPPIPPSIKVFSNESTLCMRWPKYWSFSLASFLPKKSQRWSPSEWTGWISLQSKGLSRVFSNSTFQKHQFFGAQPSSQSNSHIHTWPLEKPKLMFRTLQFSLVTQSCLTLCDSMDCSTQGFPVHHQLLKGNKLLSCLSCRYFSLFFFKHQLNQTHSSVKGDYKIEQWMGISYLL